MPCEVIDSIINLLALYNNITNVYSEYEQNDADPCEEKDKDM